MSILTGIIEICRFTGLSESTIMLKVQNEEFPAKKSPDGIWMSDKKLINKWLRGQDNKKAGVKTEKAASPKPEDKAEPVEKKKAGRPAKI